VTSEPRRSIVSTTAKRAGDYIGCSRRLGQEAKGKDEVEQSLHLGLQERELRWRGETKVQGREVSNAFLVFVFERLFECD